MTDVQRYRKRISDYEDELKRLMQEKLFEEGERFVIEQQCASITALQRALNLSYNQASQIMERLEADGVVTQPDSKGKRVVTVINA